jgi:hypothetical protein
MEMMIQLEGPIVESFYDMSLLSWAKKSDVPLPLIRGPFTPASGFKFGAENSSIKCASLYRTGSCTVPHSPFRCYNPSESRWRCRTLASTREVDKHSNHCGGFQGPHPASTPPACPHGHGLSPSSWKYVFLNRLPTAHRLSPIVAPGHSDVAVPQNVAWLAGFRLAQKNVFMCVHCV